MSTKNIFLDTSIYISKNFEFEGRQFERLLELILDNRVTLFTTTITHREIQSNIEKSVANARQSINEIKNHYVLKNTKPFKELFDTRKPANDAIEEINQNYNEYVAKAQPQEVSIASVDVDDLFEKYFNSIPPFSEKKKDEFPDAVTLLALNKWCEIHNEDMYIVSADNDMKHFCEETQYLNYIDSLESLLDLINQEEEIRYKYILKEFNEKSDEILLLVVNALESHTYELSELYGTVENVEVRGLDFIDEPNVTLISEESSKALINFEVKINYKAKIKYMDIDKSIWDSKEGGWIYEVYKDDTIEDSIIVEIELGIDDIEFDKLEESQIAFNDIVVNDNQAIYVDDSEERDYFSD